MSGRERESPAVRAVIALGANLGDREATIRTAVRALSELSGVNVVAASGLVESFAVKPGGVDEAAPGYLNAVILADITLTPTELLDEVNRIEAEFGRVRDVRWGDRTLDIDLIDVGGTQHSDERLTLPHPRAGQRAFVLAPWAQLDADAVIRGQGKVAELLAPIAEDVWKFAAAPLLPGVEVRP